MTGGLLVAISVALLFTALAMMLKQLILLPVRFGKNTESFIVLKVRGFEPKLEENLRSIICVQENSFRKTPLVILGIALDAETRRIAETYAKQYDSIILIQDGEISQWIRNLSC